MNHIFQNWTDDIHVLTEHSLTFPLHLHQTAELMLVLEGSITLTIASGKYLCKKGDIAAIFPGQLHGYESCNECKICVIIFSPASLYGYENELTQYRPVCPVLPKHRIPADIYLAYDKINALDPVCDSRLMSAWLQVILAHILKQLTMEKSTGPVETDLIYRIVHYLSLHFMEAVTLDSLAKELSVNRYYLSHTFSEKLGISFTAYLNKLRVEHARNMLHSTSDSIQTIAEKAGFETLRTFHRVFREQTGMTPTQYRQHH